MVDRTVKDYFAPTLTPPRRPGGYELLSDAILAQALDDCLVSPPSCVADRQGRELNTPASVASYSTHRREALRGRDSALLFLMRRGLWMVALCDHCGYSSTELQRAAKVALSARPGSQKLKRQTWATVAEGTDKVLKSAGAGGRIRRRGGRKWRQQKEDDKKQD